MVGNRLDRFVRGGIAFFALAALLLAQIDWNTQLKNKPTISQGNLLNIRVVDGVKFAQSAAGINAADADLGTAVGEVWIPSGGVTATDAQISIRASHTLRIFGQLTINAQTQGPILLGSASRIVCANPSAAANITNVGTGIPSMIRATVQDGSLLGFSVEGCSITAGSTTVTNGVIDFSGSTAQGWIRNNVIVGLTSGWGILGQDVQSGALAGTNNVQIVDNQITATGTGGCIEILHSATNAVSLSAFEILDTNCSGGASLTTAPVLIQNLSTTTSNLQRLNIMNLSMNTGPAAQPGLNLNGVQQASLRHITCSGTVGTCVNIANSSVNSAITIDNVLTYSGNNVFADSANSFTISAGTMLHYDFPGANNSISFLPDVGYLKVNGLAPTSATGTGFGTGATFAFDPASTNNAGHVNISTGTTPGNLGSLVVNFNTTQLAQFAPNLPPVCIFGATDRNTSWNNGVSVHFNNWNNNSVTATWSNNGANVAASTANALVISYICFAK